MVQLCTFCHSLLLSFPLPNMRLNLYSLSCFRKLHLILFNSGVVLYFSVQTWVWARHLICKSAPKCFLLRMTEHKMHNQQKPCCFSTWGTDWVGVNCSAVLTFNIDFSWNRQIKKIILTIFWQNISVSGPESMRGATAQSDFYWF